MTTRRRFVALGVTAAAGAVAGCLDGDEPLEFEAEPAVPTDAALAETGFEEHAVEATSLRDVIGEPVDGIRATGWVGTYTKAIEFAGHSADAAAFASISMPGLQIGDSERNPIVSMDMKEAVDAFQGEFEGELEHLEDFRVQEDEAYELDVLGTPRSVEVLMATWEYADETIEVRIEVARFEHDGDVVVLAGSHPTALSPSAVEIDTLMASVEHPATIE